MEKNKITTYIYNAIVILCIVGGAVYAASQFMYFGGGEVTDNARVCQNIVPQNCRVQGFIREVRFNEFQEVKKGDTLVVIEDAEFRLRLAQAAARQPSIRICCLSRCTNQSGIWDIRLIVQKIAPLAVSETIMDNQLSGIRLLIINLAKQNRKHTILTRLEK